MHDRRDLVLRGTIFAPYGRDADVSGAVYALSIENRGANEVPVDVTLAGTLGHRQLRVRTPRPFEDANRVSLGASGAVLLEGASLPGLVAVALVADGDATASVGRQTRSRSRARSRVAPGGREQIAFYLAVGPERDGAEATARVLRRRGWRELLSSTRDALQSLEQSTGHEALDRLINRNLLFAYFYGVGRALDDAQYYLVRTRAPWNGHGVTVRDWEALMWTIPGGAARRSALARELLLRDVRAARLRAGPRRPLSRRHVVRARLRARGRRQLRDRRPIATFATRATIASSTSPRSPTRCI